MCFSLYGLYFTGCRGGVQVNEFEEAGPETSSLVTYSHTGKQTE